MIGVWTNSNQEKKSGCRLNSWFIGEITAICKIRSTKQIHVFLHLFFLYRCIYESSKYQQYCRNEEECVDSRHFSSAGTWIKDAILLVNASNVFIQWEHLTLHSASLESDGGALFSRGREQHYKVIVKVFIFVKTILHKIYPDMSNASATEAAVARSLI